MAKYALNFVGNPYRWGGTSLTNGADCSGFVMSIYAQYGYSLPHSSAAQAGYGRSVSLSSVQPGDLIFYGHENNGRYLGIYHVSMYYGNGYRLEKPMDYYWEQGDIVMIARPVP